MEVAWIEIALDSFGSWGSFSEQARQPGQQYDLLFDTKQFEKFWSLWKIYPVFLFGIA